MSREVDMPDVQAPDLLSELSRAGVEGSRNGRRVANALRAGFRPLSMEELDQVCRNLTQFGWDSADGVHPGLGDVEKQEMPGCQLVKAFVESNTNMATMGEAMRVPSWALRGAPPRGLP